jgi:RNA polymerase subunit RPABC4/transcription elongation factor Spt4
VDLRCTCGALLPEDARFCHKCGKPQFEEDLIRLAEAEASAAPAQRPIDVPTATASAPIGFGNLKAVGVTMVAAGCALVALFLAAAIAPILGPVVLCAAGFAAAQFYRRRTREPLTPGGGAYLGVMTGLWLFLIVAVCAAITSIYVTLPAGREILRASMPKMPELAQMLDNPHQFQMNMVEGLIPMFFLTTISAALGGMIAARLSGRRTQQP